MYVYVIYRKLYECDECNEVTYEVNVMRCILVTFLGKLDFRKSHWTFVTTSKFHPDRICLTLAGQNVCGEDS